MQTIKVLIVSPEEMERERLDLQRLILSLSTLLQSQNIEVISFFLNDVDLSTDEKQRAEYDRLVKDCDILVEISYSMIENPDTFNLNFLLQLALFNPKGQVWEEHKIFSIKESKVMVAGEPVAELSNVPFLFLNREFQQLHNAVKEQHLRAGKAHQKVAMFPDEAISREEMWREQCKLIRLCEKLEHHGRLLVETAMALMKISPENLTPEIKQAKELFEQGKVSEANTLLHLPTMQRQSQSNILNSKENHRKIMGDIETFLLKIKIAMVDETNSMATRFTEACFAFEAAINLSQRINTPPENLIRLLLSYAYFLDQFKCSKEQLPLYTEALEIGRSLATVYPKLYLPEVAMILNHLGNLYADQDNHLQVERVYCEALEIYRSLSVEEPNLYLPKVAAALNNLGILHVHLEHYQRAELAYTEAQKIRHSLACVNPYACLPDLAATYNNLGVLYANQKNYEQAESEYGKALEIYRSLAAVNPDTSLANMATTHDNLRSLYQNQNDYSRTECENNKMLEIYLALSARNPRTYLPNVATILNHMGTVHVQLNNYPYAEHNFNQALEIFRFLNTTTPDIFLPEIAASLYSLGVLFFYTKNYRQAVTKYNEALEVYQTLSIAHPDICNSDMALILNDIGVIYEMELEDYPAAEQYFQQAEEIYKKLCDNESEQEYYQPWKDTIVNLARTKQAQGKVKEADELRKLIK